MTTCGGSLDKAGAYIVEDLGPGARSVYRPFHDLLAAHLRGQPSAQARSRRSRGRQRLAASAAPGPRRPSPARCSAPCQLTRSARRHWRSAHPYLRTYLAQHAAAAGPGTLPALAHDADFLAVADPATLTPLLPPTDPELRDIARAYRRARPLLGDDPYANAAYLQEAALAADRHPHRSGRTDIRLLYRTRLASVRRDDSLLTLTGHTGQVTSVAFGTGPDGRLLLASGSDDGTVRLWDPATGAPVGTPLTGHTGSVNSVAFGTGPDGRLLLASGSDDGRCGCGTRSPAPRSARRSPATPAPVVAVRSRSAPAPGGRPLLASGGDDGTVRLWDPVTGTRSDRR